MVAFGGSPGELAWAGSKPLNPGTDGTASEFPAKGAGNPWQSRQSPGGTVAGRAVFHEVSRAEGPSQQTTKGDGLSHLSERYWLILTSPEKSQNRPRSCSDPGQSRELAARRRWQDGPARRADPPSSPFCTAPPSSRVSVPLRPAHRAGQSRCDRI